MLPQKKKKIVYIFKTKNDSMTYSKKEKERK
jgi:hypothetical protein